MRVWTVVGILGLVSLAGCATGNRFQTPPALGAQSDRAAILALVAHQGKEAREAWEARDARRMFAGLPESTVVRTPDGHAITKAAMIADLQRRMDMTTRIDTMQGQVDSIRFVTPDEAVAWSSQRFVREITRPGQRPRVRISSVVHEQPFWRNGKAWAIAGPIQEHNQTARWADEPVSP